MTQRPLIEIVPDLIKHIRANENLVEHNRKLFDIFGGQLQKYVEEELNRTIESPEGRKGAKKRVTPINLLPKVVSKLSQVYTEPTSRTADSSVDEELIRYYEHEMGFDRNMAGANELFNLSKYVGVEPYIDEGGPRLRIIPAHQFLPYSDDPVNPTKPTVIIKFMGEVEDEGPTAAPDGTTTFNPGMHLDRVQIYHVYSANEFLIVDSRGTVRWDEMAAAGNPDGLNPIGTLPITYISRDPYRLLPLADSDMLTMTLLIPILFSNLNYAIEYLCHSITYITGSEQTKQAVLKLLPDSVLYLPDGAKIGTVSPDVDSDKILSLAQAYLAMWLESKNIRTSGMGTVTAQSHVSGLAKLIDEADATQDRKLQCRIFQDAEQDLWYLIATMHNHWSAQGLVPDRRKMSDNLKVSIRFGEMTPFVSEVDRVESLRTKIELGLISRRRALRIANPELSEVELDQLWDELKEETQLFSRPRYMNPTHSQPVTAEAQEQIDDE